MKTDEGREKQNTRTHFEAHFSLRWRTRGLSQSTEFITVRRLPAFIPQKYFDCQKTKGAGFKLLREAARSFNSRELLFEIWEREAAPAVLLPDIEAIYGQLAFGSVAKTARR